jgi:hypothetical protein
MVDVNEERTVVVDRDSAADRSSPVGWIVLLAVLLLLALFFMFGGTQLFNGGEAGTTETNLQEEAPSTQSPSTDTDTSPTQAPDAEPAPVPTE